MNKFDVFLNCVFVFNGYIRLFFWGINMLIVMIITIDVRTIIGLDFKLRFSCWRDKRYFVIELILKSDWSDVWVWAYFNFLSPCWMLVLIIYFLYESKELNYCFGCVAQRLLLVEFLKLVECVFIFSCGITQSDLEFLPARYEGIFCCVSAAVGLTFLCRTSCVTLRFSLQLLLSCGLQHR